jgi:hypothetical protein
MEFRSFDAFSPTDTEDAPPADGGVEGTTDEAGGGRGILSLARQALSHVRGTVHRVQTEAGRLLDRVRGRSSGAALRSEAGELLGKLEDHVVRLRKNFQELERIHQVLHVGTAPLEEVQELQRRIAGVEKRLSAARCQATGAA